MLMPSAPPLAGNATPGGQNKADTHNRSVGWGTAFEIIGIYSKRWPIDSEISERDEDLNSEKPNNFGLFKNSSQK
jgi:hypothetical protein